MEKLYYALSIFAFFALAFLLGLKIALIIALVAILGFIVYKNQTIIGPIFARLRKALSGITPSASTTIDYKTIYQLSNKYTVIRAPMTLWKAFIMVAILVAGAVWTIFILLGEAGIEWVFLAAALVYLSVLSLKNGIYSVKEARGLVRTVFGEGRYQIFVQGTGVHWPWEGGRIEELGPRVLDKMAIPYILGGGMLVTYDGTPEITVYDPIAFQEAEEKDVLIAISAWLLQSVQDALAGEDAETLKKSASDVAKRVRAALKSSFQNTKDLTAEGHGKIKGVVLEQYGVSLTDLTGSTLTPPELFTENAALSESAQMWIDQSGGTLEFEQAIRLSILFSKGSLSQFDFSGPGGNTLGALGAILSKGKI